MNRLEIIPVSGLPIVKQGDDVTELICSAAAKQGTPIRNRDVIVITHVFVSRAEGRIMNLDTIMPSDFAKTIAKQFDKDPTLVEAILQQSRGIIRMQDGKLITESKQGIICANSGVDRSNVPGERNVVLLPEDADRSAQNIRSEIKRLTGRNVAVVISDTNGRPLRLGEINVAIGVAGFEPIRDRRGEKDLFGYTLRIKQTAVADEFASAAELVIGQADEGIPVAIIRGYKFQDSETSRATELIRPKEKDLFI